MELKLFLAAGTVLMLAVMLYIRKTYQITCWKVAITSVLLTLSGVMGTMILYWFESGRWGGTSFFGAIFLVPICMTLAALILKVPVGTMLDLCAPSECVMLALMKIRCMYYGCCAGRVICVIDSAEIVFPSQAVEMITILCIMAILICFIKKNKYRNQIYALYMIMYGVTRFGLNLLRDTKPFIWILPAGNFWSLISLIIGIIWWFIIKRNRQNILNVCSDN